MVRALLRDDAVYRVRFAVHSTVPTVIEEEVRLHQIAIYE